jgi:mono/diheme cytochrome c family protein
VLGFADDKSYPRKKSVPGLSRVPRSAHLRGNPFEAMPRSAQAGEKLFARHCAECHGADAKGSQKAPGLRSARVAQALPGDLFWFLTNGDLRAGMPSWSRLPEAQRWQIVTYLKSLQELPVAPTTTPQK